MTNILLKYILTTQIKEAKEQARAEYIARVQDQITFGHDGRGDIAWLPFSDNDGEFYTCTFENGKAKKCTCPDCWNRKSYCKHLEALDCYLYIQSLKTIFPEKEEPVVESIPDQIAAAAEEANMKKMAQYRRSVAEDAYAVLATTKKPTYAYGCCGHLVKFEDAGELCGPCRCR